MANQPTAILVLGMHRSGTSALTRVLSLAGLDLPRRLMPPVGDNNETGFWESQDIAEIHDRFLEEIGSSWDDCLGIPASVLESATARTYAGEILAVLERDFAKSRGFVLKDPRICRFVPFWVRLLAEFGARIHLVLIERHPLEVAASLAKRDRFALGKSLHLWLRHQLDMERESRTCSRSLITYSSLLENWQRTLERLGQQLQLSWPQELEDAAPEIDEFLSATLRHHHIEEMSAAGEPILYGWAAEIHDSFAQAARKGGELAATFDRIAIDLDRAESVFAPAVADIQADLRTSHEENRRLRLEMQASTRSEIDELLALHTKDKETYEAEISHLSSSHREDTEKYEREIAKNRQMLEEFDAKIYAMGDSIQDLVSERDRLLALISETQTAFEQELAKVQSALEETAAQLREHQQALEESSRQKQELHRERADLRTLNESLTQDLRGLKDREKDLTADLERSRSRAFELQESLRLAGERQDELEEQIDGLAQDLESATQDKDWLWEQWHLTKDELAAPQQSKIGRLVWGQWKVYLSLRTKLVRLKNSLGHGSGAPDYKPTGSTPRNPVRTLGRWVGAGFLWALRWITRGLGWIYLLATVIGEQIMAALRGLSWRSQKRPAAEPTLPISLIRKPRVLLVSPYPIFPANHGGGVRLYNLIKRLSEASELHLLIFSGSGEDPDQRDALEPWAASVHFHHWQPRYEPGYWRLQPPNAALFASADLARQIAHLLASQRIDILQLEYTELGQFGLPRFAGVKVVLTEHDLAYRQHWRRRKMGFHHRYPEGNAYGASFGDWLRLTRYEIAVCRRADQIHVMSEDDGQALSRFMPDAQKRIRVVPNAVDTGFYDPGSSTEQRQGVLYVGNFQNLPNIDALEYLVADIWPQVRQQIPEARLSVLGANPSDRVSRFDGQEGVRVVGAVPDLRPYYHGHRLMVAPIRAGSGTRLKILEAFAAGLPVVSTTLGAEGIAAVSDEHLMRADDPQSFAAAMVQLLRDDDLCDRLARNALELASESYDWQRSAQATLQGWSELLRDDEPTELEKPPRQESPIRSPQEPVRDFVAKSRAVDISVVIPTFHGGEDLRRCLEGIAQQNCGRIVEVVCVDSGSAEPDLDLMRRHGARIVPIDPADFDHGLTRDLGASSSHGEILVFLNQDAIPEDTDWLAKLTGPLFENPDIAAVQGGMREDSDPDSRFFWDSCGDRFYFTRESDRWLERYYGIGFSTVNAAIRRSVWQDFPFGRAPIMEDKKWQKQVVDRRHVIAAEPDAMVIHSHNYELRSLWRRCLSEGFGWRLVGERYSALDMLRDGLQLRVHKDLVRGLTAGRIRSPAELLFPWLRPLALYWGNHWSRSVKL